MKPFDITAAKAGAPIRLSDGTENFRVICWDRKGPQGPMLVLIGTDQHEYLRPFMEDGSCFGNHNLRLMMAPIGTLGGKEIYPGDTVVDADGPLTVGNDWTHADLDQCIPPREYPTTRMTSAELGEAMGNVPFPTNLEYVANAAIKHAIDCGQLIEPTGEPSDEDLLKTYCDAIGVIGELLPSSKVEITKGLRLTWNINRG